MLADLAESIQTYLNAIPPEDTGWGGGLEIPRYTQARIALDPSTMFSDGTRGLWVSPVVTNYLLNDSSKRGVNIISVHKTAIISVILSIPFNTFKENDVGTWEEVKKVLDLRENIDSYILKHVWAQPLKEIVAEPPIEIELNQRWFLSITEFTFEGMACR